MQIWNLSDFYSSEPGGKLYPQSQTVASEGKEAATVMQILNVDETIYVADITGIRKFKL